MHIHVEPLPPLPTAWTVDMSDRNASWQAATQLHHGVPAYLQHVGGSESLTDFAWGGEVTNTVCACVGMSFWMGESASGETNSHVLQLSGSNDLQTPW